MNSATPTLVRHDIVSPSTSRHWPSGSSTLESAYPDPVWLGVLVSPHGSPLSVCQELPESVGVPCTDGSDDALERGAQPLEGDPRMRVHGLDLVIDIRALAHHCGGERLECVEGRAT